MTISVSDVNDAPDARDDVFNVYLQSKPHTLDVLANDTASPDTGETLSVLSVTQPAHGRVVIEAGGRRLVYHEEDGYVGPVGFSYTIGDGRGGTDQANVQLNLSQFWRNPRNSFDVNDDRFVSPIDILLVVNYINTHGAGALPLPPDGPLAPPPYYDVNGDNFVSPVDALLIINYLNGRGRGGSGEAEGESEGVDADLGLDVFDEALSGLLDGTNNEAFGVTSHVDTQDFAGPPNSVERSSHDVALTALSQERGSADIARRSPGLRSGNVGRIGSQATSLNLALVAGAADTSAERALDEAFSNW
ncbi:MAG TPA: dockerin type I domain-containing protein [Pirellulaceae bacterium]|nr:dockerin type I domain-containing protein [Pirellulaceae bacterium]